MTKTRKTKLKKLLIRILAFLVILYSLYLIKLLYFNVPTLTHTNPTRTHMMEENNDWPKLRWQKLPQISYHLQMAVIQAEDAQFYHHGGVDWKEFYYAVKQNISELRLVRGGSTITMQLAKNLYLPSDKSFLRKLTEIFVAQKIEKDLSKKRILEIYLNVVEWAPAVYGAEAAARHYFKKSARSLNPNQAAFLAAILPNPKRWGHWPPRHHVRKKMNVILKRMGYRWDKIPTKVEKQIPDDLFN